MFAFETYRTYTFGRVQDVLEIEGFLCAACDGGVLMWDADALRRRIAATKGSKTTIKALPDRRLIPSMSQHRVPTSCNAMTSRGGVLYVACDDGNVYGWKIADASSDRPTIQLSPQEGATNAGLYAVCTTKTHVVAAGETGVITMWPVASTTTAAAKRRRKTSSSPRQMGETMRVAPGRVAGLTCHEAGEWLMSCGANGNNCGWIQTVHVPTKTVVAEWTEETSTVRSVALFAGGSSAIAAHADGTCSIRSSFQQQGGVFRFQSVSSPSLHRAVVVRDRYVALAGTSPKVDVYPGGVLRRRGLGGSCAYTLVAGCEDGDDDDSGERGE